MKNFSMKGLTAVIIVAALVFVIYSFPKAALAAVIGICAVCAMLFLLLMILSSATGTNRRRNFGIPRRQTADSWAARGEPPRHRPLPPEPWDDDSMFTAPHRYSAAPWDSSTANAPDFRVGDMVPVRHFDGSASLVAPSAVSSIRPDVDIAAQSDRPPRGKPNLRVVR